MTRDAVIVEAVRTPIGKRNGVLSGVHPVDLSAHVLNVLVERTGVNPAVVEDVVWGCGSQVGEQSMDIARTAVLAAGWPDHIPGVTIDRQCGSSQQAVHFATAGLLAGHYDAVVAGGVESMTRVVMGSSRLDADPYGPRFRARFPEVPHQGKGAELIAARWQLSRTDLDELSLQSHQRAIAAQSSGYFDDEIAAVSLPDGGIADRDEGMRPDTTLEKLAALKPAFGAEGIITAGNSSQISDGAAALLMMTSERAAQLGLKPLARIHAAAVVGDDPVLMLTAPIPATALVLKKAGLRIDDIGAFEVNEAFAPIPLAWAAEFGPDMKLVNPNGGAIALGHPIGGSGARIMTSLIHHLRHNGIRYGLQTMCEGGGQANATIVEAL
ncbi:acetyl-CoA acetyltransferase [Mycolicibacterium rhodesiae JS60]|nr:acetyl-CoA acetyltransferase [Mycolicibacterium rhodesiae JS60]